MKRKGFVLLLGTAVIAAAVGSAAQLSSLANNVGTDAVADGENAQEGAAEASLVSTTDTVQPVEDSLNYSGVADIAEAAMPSIVSITNRSVQEVQSFFRGRAFQYESVSLGSGIIVGENDTELLICSNNHVVEDASELTVSFIDETSYEAQIKGTDPDNDLAVVAVKLEDIDPDTLDQIRIARIGDSDEMRVGEQVVAIGNALGYGQSVTTGIISAKNRSIQVKDYYDVTTYEDLIQTDAAINEGNSGGALLNMSGELIGINSAKAASSGVEGMGYAIPIDKAYPILEDLMNRVTRSVVDEDEAAYIGINGESVSEEVVELYNLPEGIYVTDVGEGSPAEAAGIERGNIITEFDGVKVSSMDQLRERLQYYSGGETVEILLQTAADGAYTEKTVSITLGLKSDYTM